MEKRLNEIAERKAAIRTEIDTADEARLAELNTELDSLETEERTLQAKANLRGRIGDVVPKPEGRTEDKTEERAAKFASTGRTAVNTRALLVSGGKIAQATELAGDINDIYGVEVSSLVDMIKVTDCTGMGTYRVPYVTSGLTAGAKTEGTAPTAGDMGFDYIDLSPKGYNVLSYVSNQIKKQSPLMYETKVVSAARTALRKKASKDIVDAVYASALTNTFASAAAVTDKTLRNIVLSHGGDEGVGGGVLVLNKADLIAFGDVRGTNEKKAVYEITPDTANENTGTIKDGGLTVRYVINSNCNKLTGATATASTMFYGNLMNIEMGTWGEIDIRTSEDYKFAEGLLSVLGETMLDVDLVVKNGLTVVKFTKA